MTKWKSRYYVALSKFGGKMKAKEDICLSSRVVYLSYIYAVCCCYLVYFLLYISSLELESNNDNFQCLG